MLTRQHFEIIAREIKTGDVRLLPSEQHGYRRAVKAMSTALRQINPRFDADRFVAACTPEDT